jgi:pyruvate,water dikinase
MAAWWRRNKPVERPGAVEDRIRFKYVSFRELLSLNNECLELMAGLQEDLQFVPPRTDVLGTRIGAIYQDVGGAVAALEKLTGSGYAQLRQAVEAQRAEVERYIASCQELAAPRLSAWLSELDMATERESGGKAAALGEVRNRIGLPVPDGYVLTTEAYRQFCGIPFWKIIRDEVKRIDLNDLESLKAISARLRAMIMDAPIPRAMEIAIVERARALSPSGAGLAVRSSAVGEGGERTFAGQFVSILNVPPEDAIDAFRRVIAGRFSERALFYRASTGLLEVESPMAVLFLPVIRARASGIMYTRNPNDPGSKDLWITATRGLGLDIASGRMPADLFVASRKYHEVIERSIVHKDYAISLRPGGGIDRIPLDPSEAAEPSIDAATLDLLADWGVRMEQHFRAPQDIEWAQDEDGKLWVVQARPLAISAPVRSKARAPKGEPLLSGGRTIYPGRVSGMVHLLEDLQGLSGTPEGAILFLHRVSPEIIEVFPRIGGLVAERGNVAGHAAALLREFRVPSVFGMTGAFEWLKQGDAVSLDAAQCRLYPGALWPPRVAEITLKETWGDKGADPIARRLLALTLIDPSGSNFRPAGCKSTHDVLRFCHEKAVEAMFAINDVAIECRAGGVKKLLSDLPVHLHVLDLGGGLAAEAAEKDTVRPEQILSRPFAALWKGVSNPAVSWQRTGAASLSDLASVISGSFSMQASASRALGEESYLLVADEYMNLNSRLAYHFSLVDACVSDTPAANYVSFRFAGGGATRSRRNLRACFIEGCLSHYGFRVDRRGDLVNAWLKKAPAEETEAALDILGRLMACSSQLDMYMTSHDVMQWHVQQFINGNYRFEPDKDAGAEASAP